MKAVSQNNHLICHKALRSAMNSAATHYEQAAEIPREIANRLLERLDLMRISPQAILDYGAKTGYVSRYLAARYPEATVYATDIAETMLAMVQTEHPAFCSEGHHLPVANDSFDLIISHLTLQRESDLIAFFTECWRVLKPKGLLLFTMWGPDTLTELKQAFSAADQKPHVHSFVDMHDIGDQMLQSRLSDPVMDMEYLTLHYSKVQTLLQEIKALGAHNVLAQRARGLMGKIRWQSMLAAYEAQRNAQQRLPATLEIIYGHAWMPEQKYQAYQNELGEVIVPIEILKNQDQ